MASWDLETNSMLPRAVASAIVFSSADEKLVRWLARKTQGNSRMNWRIQTQSIVFVSPYSQNAYLPLRLNWLNHSEGRTGYGRCYSWLLYASYLECSWRGVPQRRYMLFQTKFNALFELPMLAHRVVRNVERDHRSIASTVTVIVNSNIFFWTRAWAEPY